jgi:hypothetical protein
MALRFVGLLGHLLDQRISHLPTKITPFFKQFSFTLIWRTYGLGQRTISHQIEATYFMNKLSWEARLEDNTTEGATSWSVGWEQVSYLVQGVFVVGLQNVQVVFLLTAGARPGHILPCERCRRGQSPRRPCHLPLTAWARPNRQRSLVCTQRI